MEDHFESSYSWHPSETCSWAASGPGTNQWLKLNSRFLLSCENQRQLLKTIHLA